MQFNEEPQLPGTNRCSETLSETELFSVDLISTRRPSQQRSYLPLVVYTGVCIHLSCGIGFCAEHAAAAEMIKAGETQIQMVVEVAEDCILAPCGRCREFLIQIDPRNADSTIILDDDHSVKLRELLPHHWLIPNSEQDVTPNA